MSKPAKGGAHPGRSSGVTQEGRGHVKLCPLRRRRRGERGHVKLCPLRRRRRGERAPVNLGALCRHSRRERATWRSRDRNTVRTL
jgi:hypothetical protein